jgi:hypothetical protein
LHHILAEALPTRQLDYGQDCGNSFVTPRRITDSVAADRAPSKVEPLTAMLRLGKALPLVAASLGRSLLQIS